MAPVAKSSRGRGGGTKTTARNSGGKRISSTSSNPMGSNHSPPSVTRKPLPPQYAASPGAQHSASGSHQRPPSSKRPRTQPTVSQPTASQPTASQPAASQPTASRPAASHPSTSHPTAAQLLFNPPNTEDLQPLVPEPEEYDEAEEEEEGEEDQDVPEDEPLHPPPDEGQLLRHREAQITLEQLLRQEGRADFLPRLSPIEGEGLWFTRNRSLLTKKIAMILKEKFRGPWYSWSVTPIDVQDRYFIQLAHRYTWDPLYTPTVREQFDKVCKNRLKGLVSYVRRKRKRPSWISETLYTQMDDYWNTADAIERSENASNSRNSPRDGLGPHVHLGGPKSHAEIKDNMVKELGRPVSIGEVFLKTHTRKDGSYVDAKAKMIGEAYQQNLKAKLLEVDGDISTSDCASQTAHLTTDELNQIFLESTMEDDRGIPYGIGSLSEVHGKRKGKDTASCSSSTSTVIHLEQQLKEAQAKIAEQAALNQQREAEARQNEKKMAFLLTCMKRIAPDLPEFDGTAPDDVEPANTQLNGEGNHSNA